MNYMQEKPFGTVLERSIVSFCSVISGLLMIYLGIKGPLFLQQIHYRTHQLVINQLVAQDAVNMFLVAPILIIGGILLFRQKKLSRYLLISTPLFMMYYAISYGMGWEWSSALYTGNSERYFFHFLFILISALIILLYSLAIFPKDVVTSFRRKSLTLYSAVFVGFNLIFAAMWIREIIQVMQTGTTRGYEIAPSAFWLVRIFYLGFCIPLGFISVYLLWARPRTSYAIQMLFYGFFLTQIIAVLAMGVVMFFKHDPTSSIGGLLVFMSLAVIIILGWRYIIRNYQVIEEF
jgi:hypothetical protein